MKVQWGRGAVLGAVLAVLWCGSALAATTRYAAPGGSGTACTQAVPCSLLVAAPGAANGDTVQVAAGTYNLGADVVLVTADNVTITGAGDATRPVVNAARISLDGRGDALTDLEVVSAINGGTALMLDGADDTADRFVATSSGASSAAGCTETGEGDLFRDGICKATATGGDGVLVRFGLTATLDTGLRNVDAIATGGGGHGLRVTTAGDTVNVDVANSIMRGPVADVDLEAPAGKITVTARNSDWSSLGGSGDTSMSSNGASGNTTAAPGFVGATDLHLAPDSPLIDAGIEDPLDGATDLDGRPRWLGAHTDIGAYEHLSAPVAVTGPATGRTVTGAVVPGGLDATYHFDYGPTAAYGSSTPAVAAGAGHEPVAASAALPGLTAGTTYHYRLVATSAGGTAFGADATLTVPPPVPVCACLAMVLHGKPSVSRVAKVKHGVARLRLSCPGHGLCSGKLVLSAHSHRIGTKRFSLAPKTHRTVKVRLSRVGRRLLDRAKHHRLKVRVRVAPDGLQAFAVTVTLSGR